MEKSALDLFKDSLEQMTPQLQPLLKEDTEKFIQIAGNFISGAPKLLECTRPSLFNAIIKAAQCRLFIDGQEASIVPFKGTATMMTGYKGILKMVRNSGELASINAQVVYEKDTFEYYIDEKGEHILHKPVFGKDRGKPLQTYCIARTKGNPEPYVEVMTEEEIESCKNSSSAVKGGYDTPWKGPFADEMRKKTVIRRIAKRLPMSTDLNTAVYADDELMSVASETTDKTDAAPKTTSSRLENAIGGGQPAPEPEKKPAPAPDPSIEKDQKDIKKFKETFSQTVEGVISLVTVKDNPTVKDPAKKRRYTCKIGDKLYGTFELEIYKKLEVLYDKKVNVRLTFVTLMNSQTPPQPYNDVLDAIELVAEEEVPI